MKAFPYKRSRLGFTVTEFLVVLAIVGVLLAAGIPTVLALRKTIRIAKYDGIAREIYVAAQNSLLRLAANGMDEVTAANLSGAPAMTETKPADYEDAPTWDASKDQYRCAVNGSSAMTALLPLGAIDDTIRVNGHYYVEYNVETNIIYGVFYSDSEFKYEDVANVENFRTARSTRKGYMVGYYGGSAVLRNPSVYCPIPQLEIINTNILQLNILNRPTEVSVKVTVSDGIHEPIEATAQLSSNDSLLLDSMEFGSRFWQLFLGLQPGANLKITVTYSQDGKIPSSASVTTNSLFADRDGDTVTIAWARHLQNLSLPVSGVDSTITKARQVAHINWPSERYTFESINNVYLQRYEGSYREIRDLKSKNGLFERTYADTVLSSVRLVNPSVATGGRGGVGALASIAEKTTISNCGVYYEKLKDGIVDFSACKGGIIVDGSVSGNRDWHVGGLIGEATDCTVTNSFAALPQIDAPQGGGLIGYAENCTITNSYANCDELPVNNKFNSFLGGQNNTVIHCYAVGNVNGTLSSQFCPAGNDVTDSYFAVSHRDYTASKDLAPTQFVTYDASGNPSNKNMEGLMAWKDGWATMIAPLSHPYREFLDGRAYPYPAFESLDHYGSWPAGDGMVTLTIDMRLLNNDTLYAIHAGTVKVYDAANDATPLFDSSTHIHDGKFDGKNTVQVTPGTKIKIVVTDATGYTYVQTKIAAETYFPGAGVSGSYTPVTDYEVKKDTNITVTFQQSTFQLTCEAATAVDTNGNVTSGSYEYDVDIPGHTVHCSGKDGVSVEVETGSTVTVRPKVPSGYSATGTVIWYTLDKDTAKTKYPVLQNENGKYEFTMPGEAATLHVQYTKQVAKYTINYHLMDATEEGAYQLKDTNNVDYGIGTVINQNLIDILAANSNLLVTIDGEDVLYLDHAEVRKQGANTVFSSELKDGVMTTTTGPYTTQGRDQGTEFIVDIYIARKEYNLTLVAGENINGVAFGNEATKDTVSRRFRYGQQVTAFADVVLGQTFTAWEPDDSRFRANSSATYTFNMPSYDLTLTASARQGYYLVSLSLQENGESWLASSASRLADPVSVFLVSSKDGSVIPMETRTDDAVSYLVQAVVPSIPDLNHGYYIEIRYNNSNTQEFYTRGGAYHHPVESQRSDDRVLLTVRDRAVERDLEFFSVTYYPTAMYYLGTVPQGGTYPIHHYLTVPGNTGLLRIDTKKDEGANGGKTVFAGWKDVYAIEDKDSIYVSGETFQVTRRTDFFAEWVDGWKVVYNANGGDGGELPVDRNTYSEGETTFTVLPGNPTRTGYAFLGWATTKNATTATYHAGNSVPLENHNVTLYAVWELETYTVTYRDGETTVTDGGDYTKELTAWTPDGTDFLGWAETPDGEILYRAGDTFHLTGNLNLYARRTSQKITVTYHYGKDNHNGSTTTQYLGVGIPGYLYVPGETMVVGWNTASDLKGTFYPCDDTGKSLQAYAFTTNVDLYAVYGKVYNYQQQDWYDTLYDAVNDKNTGNGDTLIVYRDTVEDRQIAFTKNLYILANGNRTVTWKDLATGQEPRYNWWGNINGWNTVYLKNGTYEFTGCMNIQNCTVAFGRSDVSNLSMGGNSLIFDANKQSRVMALGSGGTLEMYDGITLTNGKVTAKNGHTYQQGNTQDGSNADKRYFIGGGVYAGNGSIFRMYGGTVSYCEAVAGGGVYLFPGSQMQMGNMEHPVYYSATAIYYKLDSDGVTYQNVTETVSPENYRGFFVTTGNPQISYCKATNTTSKDKDGGGGLLMLDLADGKLNLYRGSIHNNVADGTGGGIVTDGGPTGNKPSSNIAKLRIYEVDISHNRAGFDGGGILQWQGILFIYNSTLRQNSAGRNGGGIYLHHWDNTEKSNIEFYFGDIANNQAGQNGGGVYVENDLELKLLHGNLFKNTAGEKGKGGGVYMAGANSKLLLSGGSIYDNMHGYKKEDSGAVTGTDNDVYLANGAVITVEDGTLNMTHNNPGQAKNYMVLDFSNIYENRRVVEYKNGGVFQSADADEFQYKGDYDKNLFIAPTRNGGTLTAPLILTGTTDNTRTVVFDANHSGGAEEKHTAAVGTTVNLPTNFTQTGYYLYGWALSPDAYEEDYVAYYDAREKQWFTKFQNGEWTTPGTPTYTVTDLYNQRLYAMWHPYVVNYDLNTTDLSVTIPSHSVGPEVTLLAPSKNTCQVGGITYTFLGWSKDRNAKVADENYKDGKTITLTENIILYAVWQPDIVKITYHFNGSSDSSNHTNKVITVDRGDEHIVLSAEALNVTRAGYRFVAWNTESDGTGTSYVPGFKIPTGDTTQDMTLYAIWEQVWTVSFDLQGGTWAKETTYTVKNGDTFIIPTEVPTYGNFKFLGWSTDKDAVTSIVDKELKVEGNVTLYAVWEKNWEVTFDLQGGSWQEGVELPRFVKVGEKLTIPEAKPVREGFDFLGWSTIQGAADPDYVSGNEVEVHGDLTLYAIWKEKPTVPVDPGPTDPDPTTPDPTDPEPTPGPDPGPEPTPAP